MAQNSKHQDHQDCQEMRDLLHLFLDGELGNDRQLTVESHVAYCEGCQRELERQKTLNRRVDQALDARPALTIDLVPKIRDRLRDQDRSPPPSQSLQSLPWWIRAAACVAVVTGFWLVARSLWNHPQSSTPPTVPTVAQPFAPSGRDVAPDGEASRGTEGEVEDETILEHLEILEAFEDENVELSMDLVQLLLEEGNDDSVDAAMEALIDEILRDEASSDQL
ncbi:MAG: zf-HC2 domain-containing protein [Planctomycetes bacterium]|nr:zf-HC2 domain-containing protein [Planctomycetota bacterium]